MDSATQGIKERLLAHLKQIVRDRHPYLNSEAHFYVREYIRQELQNWGEVETHYFSMRGKTHQNLILNLPGQNRAKNKRSAPILIAAHYDAVPGSPGADDNATGVAVLLEMARKFNTNPPRFPLRLIAFDLEEYGMVGSIQYASELKKNQDPLRLMLSLEMLGYCNPTPGSQRYPAGLKYFYPDRGNFIALVGNLPTVGDLRHLSRHIRRGGTPCEWLPIPNQGTVVPATRLSDHSPFWDQGYRAILVTDTSFLRNPHYHQPGDTIDSLDLDFLTGVCQGLIAGIHNL